MRSAYLIILLIFTSLIYFKSLNDPLIFDDHGGKGYVNFHVSFTSPRSFSSGTFGEIYDYTKRIEVQRGFSLLIHLANTVLIYLILNYLFANNWLSLLISSFFVLNPAAIFGVTYLIERSILLCNFFGLSMIFAYLLALRTGNKFDSVILFLIALGSYYLAIHSKEHSYPLVFIFILAPFLNLNKRSLFYLVLGSVVCMLFIKQGMEVGKYHLNYEGGYYGPIVKDICNYTGDLANRSRATQAFGFFKYFYMWLNPFETRTIDMRLELASGLYSKPYFYYIIGYVIFTLAGIYLLIKKQVLGFAMTLLSALCAVEVIWTARIGEIFVLYRSYLYSGCYCLILASMINYLKLHKHTLILVTICICVIFSFQTFDDLEMFSTKAKLWERAVSMSDQNKPEYCQYCRAYSNFGSQLLQEHRYKEALSPLETAVSMSQGKYGSPLNNLGAAYHLTKQDKLARETWEKALKTTYPEDAKENLEMLNNFEEQHQLLEYFINYKKGVL